MFRHRGERKVKTVEEDAEEVASKTAELLNEEGEELMGNERKRLVTADPGVVERLCRPPQVKTAVTGMRVRKGSLRTARSKTSQLVPERTTTRGVKKTKKSASQTRPSPSLICSPAGKVGFKLASKQCARQNQ